MRPIHVAQLDKARPVLVLTREIVRPYMNTVTVAPITTTIRGLSSEVPVGPVNGLNERGVVACDYVTTLPTTVLGPQVGRLLDDQEMTLTEAIRAAFDLE
jgi:mRNA interferase MazF